MEGWGVSSEKDDALKYEHDEITCKINLSTASLDLESLRSLRIFRSRRPCL